MKSQNKTGKELHMLSKLTSEKDLKVAELRLWKIQMDQFPKSEDLQHPTFKINRNPSEKGKGGKLSGHRFPHKHC